MFSERISGKLSSHIGAGFLAAFLALFGATRIAPAAVNISDKPTKNMSCSADVCSPTAKKAVLNVGDLANMLQAADVTVTTGSGAITIEITSALSWASASRLTLDANCNVSVKAPVTVAGPAGLTIVTNDGGSGCDLVFFPSGKVDFWDLSSSLIIDGNSYVLASDIASLASDIAANPAGSYALTRDYDASADGTYNTSPIATAFGGAFEGLGHSIVNLTISTVDLRDTGLFAQIGVGGAVRDIGMSNVDILRTDKNGVDPSYVGSLAAESDGVIKNAFATGSVGVDSNLTPAPDLGGLVGRSGGTIARSYVTARFVTRDVFRGGGLVADLDGSQGGSATITDSYATENVSCLFCSVVGGLVGSSYAGTIVNSHASGNAIATSGGWAGGLVGTNTYGAIVNSSATGRVQASVGAGGLVGENAGGTIEGSYATGNVSVGQRGGKRCDVFVGGLTGDLRSAGRHKSIVANSYATGAVAGSPASCVGGLTGAFGYRGSSLLRAAYAIGSVSGQPDAEVGGAIGHDYARSDDVLEDNYWDLDTSGIGDPSQGAGNIANDPGITGLSDAQLKSGLPAGFDPTIWGQSPSINNGYPYLLANPPP